MNERSSKSRSSTWPLVRWALRIDAKPDAVIGEERWQEARISVRGLVNETWSPALAPCVDDLGGAAPAWWTDALFSTRTGGKKNEFTTNASSQRLPRTIARVARKTSIRASGRRVDAGSDRRRAGGRTRRWARRGASRRWLIGPKSVMTASGQKTRARRPAPPRRYGEDGMRRRVGGLAGVRTSTAPQRYAGETVDDGLEAVTAQDGRRAGSAARHTCVLRRELL